MTRLPLPEIVDKILEPERIGVEVDPKDGKEYVVIKNVPVFDEHYDPETETRYDSETLQHIARRNNERYADTGDFCPIVDAHSQLPDDNGNTDPEKEPNIVGKAEDFFVARHGNLKNRYCIYARRWKIEKDKVSLAKARPRRSVEIWPEKNPRERYFDPIAILGSETPRRDLGPVFYDKKSESCKQKLRYSMATQPIRYEMAAPAANNTFIPGPAKQEPIRNQKQQGADDMSKFSSDDINQLVDAMWPMLLQRLQEQNLADGKTDQVQFEDELADETPMDDILAEEDALADFEESDEELPGDDALPADQEPEQYEDGDGPISDESERDRAMYMMNGLSKQYSKGQDFDASGMSGALSSMSDSDQASIGRYMKHHCEDAELKSRYSKCCSCKSDKEKEATAKQYRKRVRGVVRQYSKLQKEHASMKQRYQKSQRENADLAVANAKLKQAIKYQKDRAAFSELAGQGYCVDPDEEAGLTATMDQEQTDAYVEKLERTAAKVPVGPGVEKFIDGEQERGDLNRSDQTPAAPSRYSKAASAAVMKLRKQGHNVSYRTILKKMEDAGSESIPELQGS